MSFSRRSLALPGLLTAGFRPLTSALKPNEARILLIAEHLRVYLGNSAGSGRGCRRRGLADQFWPWWVLKR
jgi:hypothetical protein